MSDLELAKIIYASIISSIKIMETGHDVYFEIPPHIEFRGVIYQSYHCLNKEDLDKHHQRAAQQMSDLMTDKVTLYIDNTMEYSED